MTTAVDPAYFGREQTAVKHRILKRYLTPLPLIVGRTFAKEIVYVDCCAGPWESATTDLSDTSFGIAVHQLREARSTLRGEGHSVGFRCLFMEKDASAYERLSKFCEAVDDMEVKLWPGDFTARVPDILNYVGEREDSFPFFFIDPKGWKPLRIEPLTPLLRCKPGEVLITFMTSFIRRFLEDEGKDFGALIGDAAMKSIHGLVGQERDDAIVFAYAGKVARAGGFPFVCTTLILNPLRNQTHYHLIYATRHPKGVEVFKNAERSAAEFMALARAGARERHRLEQTQQPTMFPVAQFGPGEDRHLRDLQDRYLGMAHDHVERALRRNKGKPIAAWHIACRYPLVWEMHLADWITREWCGKVTIGGMKPNQRVPRSGMTLTWTASA